MPGIPGETSKEKLKRKFSEEPWVPIGVAATALVLLGGFVSFRQGNYKRSQQMMRLRVLTQGATVIAVGVGAWGIPFTDNFILNRPTTTGASSEQTENVASDSVAAADVTAPEKK